MNRGTPTTTEPLAGRRPAGFVGRGRGLDGFIHPERNVLVRMNESRPVLRAAPGVGRSVRAIIAWEGIEENRGRRVLAVIEEDNEMSFDWNRYYEVQRQHEGRDAAARQRQDDERRVPEDVLARWKRDQDQRRVRGWSRAPLTWPERERWELDRAAENEDERLAFLAEADRKAAAAIAEAEAEADAMWRAEQAAAGPPRNALEAAERQGREAGRRSAW